MLFRRHSRPQSSALRDEIETLCQRAQFDALHLPDRLRRDIGLDCGCLTPRPPHRPPFT